MLTLDDSQKIELDRILVRLELKGIISDSQHNAVMRAVLGLPEWTDEDDNREQSWLDSLAPDTITH